MMRHIVIDTLGGDHGAAPIVEGTVRALREQPDLFAVFVGDGQELRPMLTEVDSTRYEIVHTTDFVSPDALPTVVFRGSETTSMVTAYQRLKTDDRCVAMLSAGNTGALLVGSICHLGLIPGLKFPALSSALPCMADHLVCLVDCGGNMDCTPDDLVRFAAMGNAFMRCMGGMEQPRVGLLSVGREPQKGNALTKAAFEKLKEMPLHFVGNVEGYDLITGAVDVIVTDGFAGNILLKCAETAGKAALSIAESFRTADNADTVDRIARRLFEVFDYNAQGGATFLGPVKTVVKMHGAANADTAYACLMQIERLENGGYSEAIRALELH